MTRSVPTVHIIEDDEVVRASLVALFSASRLPSKCHGSAEAYLADEPLDSRGCLVVDVRLPGMTGVELLERLEAKNCALPCLLTSGHGDAEVVNRLSNRDSVWFFEKPCDPKQLLKQVKSALDSHRSR